MWSVSKLQSCCVMAMSHFTLLPGKQVCLNPNVVDVCFGSLITSRVEVNILRSINPHFAKVKVKYYCWYDIL